MYNYTWDKIILNSSNVQRVYYDPMTRTLFVKFHSGSIAGYSGVPAELVNQFVFANSVGKFYNEHIRRKYRGIGPVDESELVKRAEVKEIVPTVATNSFQSTGSLVRQPVRRTYVVRGFIPVEEEYLCSSPEEALDRFNDENGSDAVVKEVVIAFD